MDALRSLILDPRYHDIFAILKGARNGIVYGAKVRFPHALVMSALFGRGPWLSRMVFIFQATKTHALNLAKFVSIYKTMLLLQRTMSNASTTKRERPFDTFFAGLVGGWLVFGERTAINEQIVLYVLSRVITSFLPREPSKIPLSAQTSTATGMGKGKSQPVDKRIFEALAALVWGTVMYQFANERERLAGGMVSSMSYLYLDSEKWSSLKTLLWHNK